MSARVVGRVNWFYVLTPPVPVLKAGHPGSAILLFLLVLLGRIGKVKYDIC